jgi:FAD/FMN-containing dehydrogenase
MRLTSWGKYPVVDAVMESPGTERTLAAALAEAKSAIGRGLGRSYGDSALSDARVVSSLRLNHMESFDEASGVLVAEAGVSLADILEALAPRGWFPPVTPGTKFVTLGGAIASDVHGKNHHVAGTFSRHVPWFDLWTPARGLVRCSATENADLFHATAGGHGLTGFILRAAVKLERIASAFIAQETVKAGSLAGIMDAFERYAALPFSVAWIDCLQTGAGLGRSIFMGGRFAEADELPPRRRVRPLEGPRPHALSVPFDFPSLALNSFSVRAFNALYYARAPKGLSQGIITYDAFFYPLDAVRNWNRIYGRRGFTQYQLVLPKETAARSLPPILKAIARSGQGSFLAVLKLFGKQPAFRGNISFPMEGYTLALDFPIHPRLFPLLARLDALVLEGGGRLYLTKDARMSAECFRQSYGERLDDFLAVKSQVDPDGVFASRQSRRLGLTPVA